MEENDVSRPVRQRPQQARHHASPVREAPARDEDTIPETRLHRRRKRAEDKFYIDPAIIPEGTSYEWKRESCYGAPDMDHMTALMDNHWTPVPQSRHSHVMVKKDGQVLMERPKYLTAEAQMEEYDIAMGEVVRVSQGLTDTPQGTMTRNHQSVKRVSGIKTERATSLITDRDGRLIVPE